MRRGLWKRALRSVSNANDWDLRVSFWLMLYGHTPPSMYRKPRNEELEDRLARKMEAIHAAA